MPAPLPLPAALRTGAARTPEGAAWVSLLPGLVARSLDRWTLTAGAPFPSGSASWCAPVRAASGAELVLKISFPHDEARHEAAVLRAWGGRGAVRLVDHDVDDWALLLDRVHPGTPLRAARTPVLRRLAEAADVLRALHAVPPPTVVPALGDVTAGLADLLRSRVDASGVRVDPALLRDATAVLDAGTSVAAPGSTGAHGDPGGPGRAAVLLHGDLNPGNLLRRAASSAGPAAWCAIDPKVLRGDPAYDPWPLLEQVGDPWRAPDPVRTLRDRTRLVATRAGLDAGAVAAWAVARSVEAALWEWQHAATAAAVRRRLARAGDWARVRDAATG